jgi:hypothetical protein
MDPEKELNLMYRAAAEFGIAFAQYIKEVDPVLWERAREFAFDYTKEVDGVKLIKSEDTDV